jgi:hypothetical protein
MHYAACREMQAARCSEHDLCLLRAGLTAWPFNMTSALKRVDAAVLGGEIALNCLKNLLW